MFLCASKADLYVHYMLLHSFLIVVASFRRDADRASGTDLSSEKTRPVFNFGATYMLKYRIALASGCEPLQDVRRSVSCCGYGPAENILLADSVVLGDFRSLNHRLVQSCDPVLMLDCNNQSLVELKRTWCDHDISAGVCEMQQSTTRSLYHTTFALSLIAKLMMKALANCIGVQ